MKIRKMRLLFDSFEPPFIAVPLDIIYFIPLQAVHALMSPTFQRFSSGTDKLRNGGPH